jgi:hypothetical protein
MKALLKSFKGLFRLHSAPPTPRMLLTPGHCAEAFRRIDQRRQSEIDRQRAQRARRMNLRSSVLNDLK